MRIYFVGIGGAGIGPLALIAHESGYEVVGSDQHDNSYVKYLREKGIEVYIDQSGESIKKENQNNKIDWVVGVSSIIRDTPNHPELVYARENKITITERDSLLNKIIKDKNLDLVAVAGTHGKTTTTAMIIWLMNALNIPISYSVGAKLTFAEMSKYDSNSKYFIYECDEFHKNFLNFSPYIAAITGIAWDHHEIFKTEQDYNQSFIQFLEQSKGKVIYSNDICRLGWKADNDTLTLEKNDDIENIKLFGRYFREDAWLAINTVQEITKTPLDKLIPIINQYPGSGRRMEKIAENIYSDYAHTPEKITGCITTAQEMLGKNQKLVIIYEPLTNRRQHYIKHYYKDLFTGVDKLYWVPSYKAREDATLREIEPIELIASLSNKNIASPEKLDEELWQKILNHQHLGDFIVLISGGGGGSLDEWARKKLNS